MIFRDLRYIIKKVIIGIAIIIGVMFFKTKLSFAATVDTILRDYSSSYIGTGYWYKGADSSTTIDMIGMGPELPDENIYYNFLFCTTADYGSGGTAWTNSSDPNSAPYNVVKFVSGNLTNIECTISGTNVKGRIYQVTGNIRTGQDGGGDIRMVFHFSFHDSSSTNLIKYGLSASPFDLIKSEKDYTNQLSSMSTLIDNKWTQEINKLQDILGVSQQQLAEAQAEVSDNDTDAMQEWLEDFTSDTYGLTSIITAPLETISSLTNKTCSPLNLPIPYVNETLTLPCMSTIYSNTFGSAFTMYQTITTALIGYWCVVRMFAIVKGMKDPNDDKIEVVDL